MGFPCGKRLQYLTGVGKLQVLLRISNVNGSSTNFIHSGVSPPQRYTYDLPAPPTPEEVVKESERALGESLKQLATINPVYTHLTTFSGLQQISDMVNSATKNAADANTQEKQRVTPPDLPGRQRVGPPSVFPGSWHRLPYLWYSLPCQRSVGGPRK